MVDIIEKPDHISVSQARMWLKCQEQWRQKYILRLKGKYSVRMALGIGVHAGIAQINAYRQCGDNPDWDQVFSVQRVALEDQFSSREYMFDDMRSPDEVERRGQKILRLVAGPLDKVTGLPMLIEHSIGEGIVFDNGVKLSGYVDLVDVNGSIYDFKIGARPKTQADVDQDLQLSLYAYALNGRIEQPVKVSLVSVNSKDGDVHSVESYRTQHDAALAYQTLNNVAKQIDHAVENNVFVPNVEGGWWCSSKFCEYYNQCEYGGRDAEGS